jgi:hypothetical protein
MNAIEERSHTRGHPRVHFDNEEMDLYLSRFMGYATYGGAQHGECLRVAAQVEDGNPHSWVDAWCRHARYVEAHAMATLEAGHLLSAREAYLRACTYYRAALAFLHPFEPRYLDAWEDMRSCFRMAAALFQPPITHVEIPFEGTTLPGYFMRVSAEHTPHPTLIAVGDGDTFAEELYFWAAAPGALRGYNTLFVELPGQGSTPLNGLFFRVDAEVPMRAVVDYALGLPDVDPERLYAYGVSGGGYMVARAAAHDERIKACVLNAPVTDVYRLLASELPEELLDESRLYEPFVQVEGAGGPVAELMFEKLCWRAGTACLGETLALAERAHLGDLVGQIRCPTFCLVSHGERAERNEQARQFYNHLRAPKQLRIFTDEEGAELSSCGNLSLMHATLFDWLDEL